VNLTDLEKHLRYKNTFTFKLKKVISLVFALSVIGSPSLSWVWGGEGGCSYSKDKSNKEIKTEQVKETDA
tara:strand:- start:237 stop:446 length:210 start_codon:yes stop_codon:yes gene_type:complete